VHFLTEVDRLHKWIVNELKLTHHEYFARSKHYLVSQYLQREIKRGLKGKKWKVITLVRNPLELEISSFFQIVDLIVPDFPERCRKQDISVEELTAAFTQQLKRKAALSDWFDREMEPAFGIDVYAHPFPARQGYQIYRAERADLLLMRLEDLERSAACAFKEFLGIEEFSVIKRNTASGKYYAGVYEEFTRTAGFPQAYIDQICERKSARHFYTADELDQFKAAYSNRKCIEK
jgi:hypothetical protein